MRWLLVFNYPHLLYRENLTGLYDSPYIDWIHYSRVVSDHIRLSYYHGLETSCAAYNTAKDERR